LELDPKFPRAHSLRALISTGLGKRDDALRSAGSAVEFSNNGLEYRGLFGHVLGRLGRRQEAERVLTELLTAAKREYVAPTIVAWVYSGLGDKDKAFEWLEKAYDNRLGDIVYLNLEPAWEPLRDDPRYAALAKKVGLPQ
jgi:tetratricopeptide (TPR) repeat protein